MITTLFILLILVSAFLVMIILVQRGRGGGLSGAFGSGGGSSSAFGTKTGDVFTTLTVVTFVVFIVLAIILSFQFKYISPPAPPTDVTATNVTESGFTVAWTDSADNETYYKIEQYNEQESTSTVTKWTTVKELPASPDTGTNIKTTVTNLHLEPGKPYKFHVLVGNGPGYKDRIFDVSWGTATTGPTITSPETAASGTAPATTTRPATTTATTAASATAPATTSAPASMPASTTSAPATRP